MVISKMGRPAGNLIGEKAKDGLTRNIFEFERGTAHSHGLKASLEKVKNVAKKVECGSSELKLIDDPDFAISRDRNSDFAMENTELRILSSLSAGKNVGPESSLGAEVPSCSKSN